MNRKRKLLWVFNLIIILIDILFNYEMYCIVFYIYLELMLLLWRVFNRFLLC